MQKISYILIIISFIFDIVAINAQSPESDAGFYIYHTLDRMQIKSGTSGDLYTEVKCYTIGDIVNYSLLLRDSFDDLTDKDLFDIDYILKDNIDWMQYFIDSTKSKEIGRYLNVQKRGIFNRFYRTESSFYTLHKKRFFMKIDPVINFSTGKDITGGKYYFQNTRGIVISGLLDRKIYFHTSLYETQQSFLPFITRRIKRDYAVPGQGYYKIYNSGIFKNVQGYDFLNAKAYFGFNITKSLSAQIGHGRFFIGDGIRSLFLSDYSNNYYYLKFDTKVWKFLYRNIFAELSAKTREEIGIDTLLPKKYMAAHYLGYRISKNFRVGLFENVIFSRKDHYEFQYLNPIILFRTVEQFIGSSDNVIVGIDWKYNFLHRFSLYGQFLLDEFRLASLKEKKGWWANKHGLQLGLKYIDIAGIDHLDLQIEGNTVRPYTYSHRNVTNSYSHFNQPLAHPLGANFKELIVILNYRFNRRFFAFAKAVYALQGEDKDNRSWGGNILLSNDNRPLDNDGKIRENGFYTGNGAKRTITQYSLNLSYMFFHNYSLYSQILYRKEISQLPDNNLNIFYIKGGIKININNKNLDY